MHLMSCNLIPICYIATIHFLYNLYVQNCRKIFFILSEMKKKLIILPLLILFSISCTEQRAENDLNASQRKQAVRTQIKQKLGDKYDANIPAATDAQLERGQALFDQLCAPCHGHRGDGEGVNNDALVYKPSDLTDPVEARFFSEQARLYIIRNGIEGTAMMSWKNMLPEDDLLSVYLYTRSLIKNDGT